MFSSRGAWQSVGWILGILATSTGCYTLEQGYHQVRLLAARKPVTEVLSEGTESPERLEKLKLLPRILDYARAPLGLTPGDSYTQYVGLEGPYLTWTVQAAEKRALRQKTWWFPIVGSQPYLGYFSQDKAIRKRDELVEEGFDTIVGGVRAFSLLGYFSDPVYSSMLDGVPATSFIETIFHESVHSTIYVPNFSAFNENLAEFIGKQATVDFLRANPLPGADPGLLEEKYGRELVAQRAFREYLIQARKKLEDFYAGLVAEPKLDDAAFEARRRAIFDEIAAGYQPFMAGREAGTSYAGAFAKGRLNNAVVLAYALYEAHHEPFEQALANAGGSLPRFISNMKECLREKAKTENELWERVTRCGGPRNG